MTFGRFIRISRHRLRALLRKETLDSELDREFAFHFEQLVQENIAGGMSAEEAALAARRAFGNVGVFREEARDHRGVAWLHDLWQDLSYGLRMLRKNRGFTAIAVISLALGIGANTVILSAIDSVLRGSLPYVDPDRLVMIRTFPLENPSQVNNASLPDYFAWKERSVSFEALGASLADQKDIGAGEDGSPPERLLGKRFSPELFSVLGIQPVLGRLFSEDEYRPGAPASVLIGLPLWQRRFGGDPKILNTQVRLNGFPTTIVGVMPSYFPYAQETVDYWIPMPMRRPTENSQRFFIVTGRLKHGVTMEQAQSELNSIAAQLSNEFPDRHKGWGVRVQPLRDFIYGWTKPPLVTLEAAVAFVLLIACANVAGLLLARGSARRLEITMRVALGAGRGRIVRQLLTESVLLAMIGGSLGLFVARWGLDVIANMSPPPGAPKMAELHITFRTLGLTVVTSVLTGIGFGLFPAVATFKSDLVRSLKVGAAGASTPSGRQGLRGILTAGQLALAFMLLIGFGLMMKSSILLATRSLNFDTNGLLSFEFRVPQQSYMKDIGTYRDARYYDITPSPALTLQRVYDRLRRLPGGVAVAGSSFAPVNSLIVPSAGVILESDTSRVDSGNRPLTAYFLVTPNFFETLRAPLISGRDFNDHDVGAAPWVAVVNEAAAHRFWPGQNPIGKRFTLDTVPEERPRQVIGLVRDIPTRTRQTTPQPVVYLSYLQQPARAGPSGNMFGQMIFMVRGREDPMSYVPLVRQAVAEVEPERALSSFTAVNALAGTRLEDLSWYAVALGGFAIVATALAAIGVYGVVSYSAAQRTREIAIRAALGAGRREIVMLVGGHALILISFGLFGGIVGSLVLTDLLASQLWGITSTDPSTFLATSLVFAITVLLACYVPVRRATQVDPVVALRSE